MAGTWHPDGNQYLNLFKSLDGGEHWTQIELPDSTSKITSFFLTSLENNVVFMSDLWNLGSNICVSSDHGLSWEIDSLIPENNNSFQLFQQCIKIGELPFIAIASTSNGSAVIIQNVGDGANNCLSRIEKATLSVQLLSSIVAPVTLFPNPANSNITLTEALHAYSILDPLGRAYSVPRNGNTLDVSSLPAGIYFIVDGGSTTGTPQSAKFVKE